MRPTWEGMTMIFGQLFYPASSTDTYLRCEDSPIVAIIELMLKLDLPPPRMLNQALTANPASGRMTRDPRTGRHRLASSRLLGPRAGFGRPAR